MPGIRTALKPDLECSAAELVYGTALRIPGDFFGYSQSSTDLDPSDYVQRLRQAMTHLRATPPRPSTSKSVNRVGLWKIMQKFNCFKRFTPIVHQLHDGIMARLMDNRAVSEAFAVTNGVKQSYVLAHTLFSLISSAMLMDAFRDERPGTRIAYRTDGHLLNHRRMHFQSQVSTITAHGLLFVDDCDPTLSRKGTCKGAWTQSLPPAKTSVC
nr:unnamed protein product [Spirometra erinaceieuropaei]